MTMPNPFRIRAGRKPAFDTIGHRPRRPSRRRPSITIERLELRTLPSITNLVVVQPINELEGSVAFELVATFVDTAPNAGSYQAAITFGDGTTGPGFVSSDPAVPGLYDVFGFHQAGEEGALSIQVGVTDLADVPNTGAVAGGTIIVNDAPLVLNASAGPIAATEGVPYTLPLLTFSDSDPGGTTGDFAATIDWGDGQKSKGVIGGSPGNFTVAGTHTYADETLPGAPRTVVVTVTDTEGQSQPSGTRAQLVASIAATVGDAPITAGLPILSPTPIEGQAFAGLIGVIRDANPGAVAADFSANGGSVTIDWGDGTSSPALAVTVLGGGTFSVSGTHTYAEEGSYKVTMTAHDAGGATGSVAYSLAVADATISAQGGAFSAVEGATYTGNVATFVDANPGAPASDFAATIDWGDGSQGPGTVALVSRSTVSATFSVAGSHRYAEEGNDSPKVTVLDVKGGSMTSATGTASVADAPFSPPTVQPSIAATEGAAPSVLRVANFRDADPGAVVGDFVATIDWGDGTGLDSTSVSIAADGAGGFWVQGSHAYAEEGNHRVVVTIVDIDGAVGLGVRSSLAMTNMAAVADAVLSPISVTASATEGLPFAGAAAKFADADPGAVVGDHVATIDWGDGTAPTPGAITQPGGKGTPFFVAPLFAHIYPEEGTFTTRVTVVDLDGGADGPTRSRVVVAGTANVGEAPLLPSAPAPSPLAGNEGIAVSGVVASFINADAFETEQGYVATIVWGDGTSSPATSITPNGTGGFNVKGSHAYAEEGSYTVSVSAAESDGLPGGSAVFTTRAIIADAPLTAQALTVAPVEGAAFAGAVATFSDADPGATAADFQATIDWGDGSPTTPGTVVVGGAGVGFLVKGSHAYSEEGVYANNPFTGTGGVRVTIVDTDGGSPTAPGRASAMVNSTAVVADAPLSPVAGSVVNTAIDGSTIVEGKSFLAHVAAFLDADPSGAVGDYTATINWGDGSAPTQGTVTTGSGGQFVVSGGHAYAEDGTFNVLAFVGDAGGSTTVVAATVSVADATLTSSPIAGAFSAEGATFSGLVATFADADPHGQVSDYVARIDWGDGTSSDYGAATTAIIPIGAGFGVNGSHRYAEEGTFAIRVTIVDADGGSPTAPGRSSTTAAASSIIVVDAPLSAAAGPAISGVEGTLTALTTLASFTDSDPAGVATDYVATINWGDGKSSPGTIAASGTGFVVQGRHAYAEEGAFVANVVITDTDGGPIGPTRASVTAPGVAVTIADAPLSAGPGAAPLAAVEGATLSGVVVGTFFDADPAGVPGDFVATINWGDGTASVGVVSQAGGAGTALAVRGTHAYLEEGTFLVIVTAVDTDGLLPPPGTRSVAALVTTASVVDAPLSGRPSLPAIAATEGLAITNATVASFTDADPGAQAGDFVATIDWGDGVPGSPDITPGVVSAVPNSSPTVWAVSGPHTYAEEGSYQVKVSITDDDHHLGTAPGAARATLVAAGATVVVADAPIVVTSAPFNIQGAPEGSVTANVTLAIFKDGNPGATVADFTTGAGRVVINWGDGTAPLTLPASSIQPTGGGFFIVRGSHVYAEDGVFSVNVAVTDKGGAPTAVLPGPDTLTVPDAALSALANPQSIRTVQGVLTGPVVLGTFADADFGAQVGDYAATINWGDGTPPDTTSASIQSFAPLTFNVLGKHTFAATGVFSVTVTVVDVDAHLSATPGVGRMTATLKGTTVTVRAALVGAGLGAGTGVGAGVLGLTPPGAGRPAPPAGGLSAGGFSLQAPAALTAGVSPQAPAVTNGLIADVSLPTVSHSGHAVPRPPVRFAVPVAHAKGRIAVGAARAEGPEPLGQSRSAHRARRHAVRSASGQAVSAVREFASMLELQDAALHELASAERPSERAATRREEP
jgi:hypothetical protein